MRDPKQVLLAFCAFAIAVVLCGAAEARTGLVPVVVEGGLGLELGEDVQHTALRTLAKHGVNPPEPWALLPHLGLANPTDPPTTAQCIAAGGALGLDVVAIIRVRPSAAGMEAEMRVVVVETRKEYRYSTTSDIRHALRAVHDLVTLVFEDLRAWDTDLLDVEHALGRDRDRLYVRYLASDGQAGSFAGYMYDRAERRKHLSLALAITVPTLIAGATVAFGVGTRGIWINEESDNEDDCFTCGIGDILIGVARVAVVLGIAIGTAGAILSGVGAGFSHFMRKKEMERLRPLLSGARADPPPVSWQIAPYASPEGGGLALDLRF